MTRRAAAVAAGLALLMALFGWTVYRTLGHFASIGNDPATTGPQGPLDTTTSVALPGTLYLSQQGGLFALRGGHFAMVLASDARGGWIMPSALANGDLLVVARAAASSDVYEVRPDGHTVRRLTYDSAPTRRDGSLQDNHWAFEPAVGGDGSTMFFTYDSPKADVTPNYLVNLAVWSMPLPPGAQGPSPTPPAGRPAAPVGGVRWTTPNDYTGGDIDPVPLRGGGVIFTRYSIDAKVHSQLWYVAAPKQAGHALTDLDQNCSQPSVSPDGASVAMICTGGQQTTRLEVAPLLGTPPTASTGGRPERGATGPSLGPARTLLAGVLAAQPVWAPDGSGLVYLAPADTGGNFQLWWVAGAAAASPAAPVQVTTRLGFDATSRPAWVASPG